MVRDASSSLARSSREAGGVGAVVATEVGAVVVGRLVTVVSAVVCEVVSVICVVAAVVEDVSVSAGIDVRPVDGVVSAAPVEKDVVMAVFSDSDAAGSAVLQPVHKSRADSKPAHAVVIRIGLVMVIFPHRCQKGYLCE